MSSSRLLPEHSLTDDERRVILLFKLYQKEHRTGAPWSWVRERAGLTRRDMQRIMFKLRRRKAIVFKHGVSGSTFATERGVQAALERQTPLDGALVEA